MPQHTGETVSDRKRHTHQGASGPSQRGRGGPRRHGEGDPDSDTIDYTDLATQPAVHLNDLEQRARPAQRGEMSVTVDYSAANSRVSYVPGYDPAQHISVPEPQTSEHDVYEGPDHFGEPSWEDSYGSATAPMEISKLSVPPPPPSERKRHNIWAAEFDPESSVPTERTDLSVMNAVLGGAYDEEAPTITRPSSAHLDATPTLPGGERRPMYASVSVQTTAPAASAPPPRPPHRSGQPGQHAPPPWPGPPPGHGAPPQAATGPPPQRRSGQPEAPSPARPAPPPQPWRRGQPGGEAAAAPGYAPTTDGAGRPVAYRPAPGHGPPPGPPPSGWAPPSGLPPVPPIKTYSSDRFTSVEGPASLVAAVQRAEARHLEPLDGPPIIHKRDRVDDIPYRSPTDDLDQWELEALDRRPVFVLLGMGVLVVLLVVAILALLLV